MDRRAVHLPYKSMSDGLQSSPVVMKGLIKDLGFYYVLLIFIANILGHSFKR